MGGGAGDEGAECVKLRGGGQPRALGWLSAVRSVMDTSWAKIYCSKQFDVDSSVKIQITGRTGR